VVEEHGRNSIGAELGTRPAYKDSIEVPKEGGECQGGIMGGEPRFSRPHLSQGTRRRSAHVSSPGVKAQQLGNNRRKVWVSGGEKIPLKT